MWCARIKQRAAQLVGRGCHCIRWGHPPRRLPQRLRPGNEHQQIHADASVSSAGNVTSSSSRSDVASDSVYASPSGKVMLSSGARR